MHNLQSLHNSMSISINPVGKPLLQKYEQDANILTY